MVFVCYNCLYKIKHNVIKAHDKNFCGTICRDKYFTNNNYDINNIGEFIENKYFNTTINSSNRNSSNINSKNIYNNDIKNLNTDSYTYSNKCDFENHNNMMNHNYDSSYDSFYYSLYDSFYNSGNKIKKGFFRTCDLFTTIIAW